MRPNIGGLLIPCLLILFFPLRSQAQVVFGEYSDEELALESVPFEPEAKQVTLYEKANSYFKVNGIYTDYIYRIKVLDDNSGGFGDFRILFYKGDYLTEDITRLKAQVSYPDEGGRKAVILSNKIHIKEVDLGDGYFEFRIAFPNVKKGSILEYTYAKMDRSISLLDGWAFQKEIPALVSKYTFKAPDHFQYQMITQGKVMEGAETATYLGGKIPKAKYPEVVFKDSTQKGTSVKVFDYVSKNYKGYSSRWLEPYYSMSDFLVKKEEIVWIRTHCFPIYSN